MQVAQVGELNAAAEHCTHLRATRYLHPPPACLQCLPRVQHSLAELWSPDFRAHINGVEFDFQRYAAHWEALQVRAGCRSSGAGAGAAGARGALAREVGGALREADASAVQATWALWDPLVILVPAPAAPSLLAPPLPCMPALLPCSHGALRRPPAPQSQAELSTLLIDVQQLVVSHTAVGAVYDMLCGRRGSREAAQLQVVAVFHVGPGGRIARCTAAVRLVSGAAGDEELATLMPAG